MALNNDSKARDLIKKRGSVKAKLTQFSSYLSSVKSSPKLSEAQLVELELRIDKIDTLYSLYDELQIELELLTESPDELYIEREQFESSYYSTLAAARQLVNKYRTHDGPAKSEVGSSDVNATVVSQRHKNVRLPIISLPHFSGGYKNWLEFKDLYISLIHEDKTLDDITKFHYLRTSLQGSAAIIIHSLDFRSDNYQNAWKLLCDRYDNKQLLVNNHVHALFNVEPVHKESSQSLRQIVDVTNKNLRALATLGQPVQYWDTLIIHIMSSKLDSVTNRHWEEHRNLLDDAPSLEVFTKFINNRSNLLENIEESKGKRTDIHTPQNKQNQKTFVVTSKTHNITCPMCNKDHYIFNCDNFKALSTEFRLSTAKQYKLCLNCLRPGHNENKCKLGHCKYCKCKHNTLLHKHEQSNVIHENVTLSAHIPNLQRHVLLSTALVQVRDNEGQPHRARVLLDNGSTANLISQELNRKLNLPIRSIKSSKIIGINNQVCDSTQTCSLRIESYNGDFMTDIDCFIVPKITSQIPTTYIHAHIPIPSEICLADPSYNVPSSVDILVGADVFWSVIGAKRIQLGKHKPTLFDTKLGWLMSGSVYQSRDFKPVCMFVHENQTSTDISRFWELDTISSKHSYTRDERTCEEIFLKTTKRNNDGRFVVTIPLKESPEILGSSYNLAKRRFLSLERKLQREPIFKERYVDFMKEYEELGHMSENTHYVSSNKAYYLPHHGVVRESSMTTKLRVVFDASAPTSSGKSLNNIQLVGPTIQDDLLSILMRFRQHQVVVTADIEKMYRCILVEPSQRSLQQILWRSDPSQRLKRYTLNTVTYGTASAPFLSTRCLVHLSRETSDLETQRAIAHDFYVDDFLSGTDSSCTAIALCHKVSSMLKSAQFNLRKWQSNSVEVLKAVSNSDYSSSSVNLSAKELSKTLGLHWQCCTDTLTFSIHKFVEPDTKINKCHILSTIAQVFDPLGLVSPCIVEAKMLMQKLWLEKCSWDDEVSNELKQAWINFAHTLPHLNYLKIPRCVVCISPVSIQLHVFSDASEKAYGACVYVRTKTADGLVTVHLLSSKSKVAPIKPTTMPRLELCGALLGTRLLVKVQNSLTLTLNECTLWCDSTIVLGWLSSSPLHLKSFVRNRVCEIQDTLEGQSWRYVPTKENPADLVSRGLSANHIGDSSLWWSGPTFLSVDPSSWPGMPNTVQVTELPETIKSFHLTDKEITDDPIQTLIQNSSKFSKLQRITAYLFRFISNCRTPHAKYLGSLTTLELNSATNHLVQSAQRTSFPSEYRALQAGKTLPLKSRIKSLSPFLENGIIRVGGRLSNSYYDYNVKHPILLCSKHKITKLIFSMFHLRLFHAGPQLLLTTIRHHYWPLGGRNLARQTTRSCIKCLRFKGETIQPVMGNLPKERLQLEFPFLETGTDYAGPVLVADRKGRGCRLVKSYICVFICLATKAVHLELVSDLTKEAFIAALNRFTARRGKPKNIYSDNGTTFVGCFNELSNILQHDYTHELAEAGINFSFIPAYTPHFGGLWESAVKSVKHHLRRILGLTHLTYEEMSSCLIQVEAILNSRPLTALSDDPCDLTPLTPAHFLIGRSLMFPSHPQITSTNITKLQRFQRVEQLKQHFWNRFTNEYVSSLQQKTKWHHSTGHLEEGALVIVKDKTLPPLMWLLGRVVRLLPGKDGVARVADVKTKKGVIRRAYNTLCPLPTYRSFEQDASTRGVYVGDNIGEQQIGAAA